MKIMRFGKMVCVGLLAVTTAFSSMCIASAATDSSEKLDYFLYGDVDMDGKISVNDMTLTQKFLSNIEKPSEVQKTLADVDGDGRISIKDVTMFEKYFANLSDAKSRVGTPSDIKLTYAMYGDVDRDGAISTEDATLVLDYVSGSLTLTSAQKKLADVNGDGKVTADDATIIQNYVAHKATEGIIGTESDIPAYPVTYAYGDVNMDGKVTIRDVTDIQKQLVRLTTLSDNQKLLGDVDGDGYLSIKDVTTLMKYIVGYKTGIYRAGQASSIMSR